MEKYRKRIPWDRLNWVNTIFLILCPIIVAIGVPLHIVTAGFDFRLFMVFVFACGLTSLSITGGYHRLFAHKSYEASTFFQFLYLIFGAAALQGSALKWSTDHRRHHRHVDSEKDPYSIQKGFWYAHIGWVFFKEDEEYNGIFAPDLANDKWLAWQHRHYYTIAIVVGFVLPTIIGAFFGHAWGGLLWGGFARVLVTHHCTFFINSLCHYWGSQPYGNKTSARDNFVMAFLTYGEGYHNFHHRFQIDYRNGIKWYQWDPTKWLIWFSSRFGMTTNLRRVDDVEILKARVRADEYAIRLKGISEERLNAMMERLISTRTRIKELQESYRQLKLDLARSYDERWEEMAQRHKSRVRMLKAEIGLARLEFKMAMAQWKLVKNASILGSF
jgi:stearoyl-CoA desaturase (delta-9 desaturase)